MMIRGEITSQRAVNKRRWTPGHTEIRRKREEKEEKKGNSKA